MPVPRLLAKALSPRAGVGDSPGAPGAARRRSALILSCLLLSSGVATATVAWHAAPAGDETAHVAAGLYYWRFGRFDVYTVNPPLTELIAAAPVAAAGYVPDWTAYRGRHGFREEWTLGADWLAANGRRGLTLVWLARLALIPVVAAGGWVCYLWSRDLFGATSASGGFAAGTLSCVLWCFNPSLLAHGGLVAADAAAAAAGVAAGYAFWRFLRRRDWRTALAAGLLLGLANLTKTTWVLLFVLWPALRLTWLIAERRDAPAGGSGRPRPGREAASLGLVLAVGLVVLNAGYGFDGSFTPLGEYGFVSETLSGRADGGVGNRFADTPLAGLPVPAPRDWLLGVDLQRRDFEEPHPAYLFGVWREGGWWHYYLAVFAVKEPAGLLLLLLLAVCANVARGGPRARDLLVVAAPAAAVFLTVSSQTALNRYPRYLLPAYGFLFVWCGGAVRAASTRPRGAAVLFCGCASVAAGLSSLPYPHAYFNLAAGGPLRGHLHLSHSALDAGQSARALAVWQRDHPESPLDGVAGPCRVPPALYGLPDRGVPPIPRPGRWAVSAERLTRPAYAAWAAEEPEVIVGGNMRVYAIRAD